MLLSVSPIAAGFERAAARRIARQSQGMPIATASKAVDQNAAQVDISESPAESSKRSRALQHVLTTTQKATVIKWMVETVSREGEKHLSSKTVDAFPQYFRSSRNAALMKALRLWRNRAEFCNGEGDVNLRGTSSTFTRVAGGGVKRVNMKALSGRGPKRVAWVNALHKDLVLEFDRLRRLGVKFNMKTLRALASSMIQNSESPKYSMNMAYPGTNICLSDKITPRWIQTFCDRYQIVSRALTGKLLCSPAKEAFIEKEVAYHLRQVSRAFKSGELQKEDVGNSDETHFVINVDNGRTLGFKGEEEVK